MSFEAVWGFNPDRVLRAQKMCLKAFARESSEDQVEVDDVVQDVGIPRSDDAQLYGLRRMFRL